MELFFFFVGALLMSWSIGVYVWRYWKFFLQLAIGLILVSAALATFITRAILLEIIP